MTHFLYLQLTTNFCPNPIQSLKRHRIFPSPPEITAAENEPLTTDSVTKDVPSSADAEAAPEADPSFPSTPESDSPLSLPPIEPPSPPTESPPTSSANRPPDILNFPPSTPSASAPPAPASPAPLFSRACSAQILE
ncbi:hypothetical protein [Leptothermofonsia sp. ETS-13]|uniref:hypothetical protein n=1 Tax=Leptothermofonsia sp. ETS-13 TaxID=3035696 RepID=UPI003B9E5982